MVGKGAVFGLLGWSFLGLAGGVQTPRSLDLRPIPFPPLSDLEESVREQIETSQELLRLALKNPNIELGDLGQLYGQLGQIYHSYDFVPAAEACYRNARFLRPADYRWHHYLGLLYQRMGNVSAAEHALEIALALEASDTAARLLRGNLFLESNQLELAEKDFSMAIKQVPESAAALTGLGRLALRRGDHQRALDHFQQVRRLVPAADSIHYLIAQAYRGLGDLESAKTHLEQRGTIGVAIRDPLMDYVKNIVQGEIVHLLRGRQAFSSGDFEAARALFQKAVAAAPESTRARVNLAATLSQLGEFAAARNELGQGLTLAPGNYVAMFNLGALAFRQADYPTAVANLQPFVAAFSDDAQAVGTLGLALLELGRPEEAVPFLRKANLLTPRDEDLRLKLAQNLMNQGSLKEALELLGAANHDFADQFRTAFLLAQLLATSSRIELRDGQEAYRLALKVYQAGKMPPQAAVVALALAEMGRCESAARWQQTAIALAQKQGNDELAVQLTGALSNYQDQRPCRPGIPPG